MEYQLVYLHRQKIDQQSPAMNNIQVLWLSGSSGSSGTSHSTFFNLFTR